MSGRDAYIPLVAAMADLSSGLAAHSAVSMVYPGRGPVAKALAPATMSGRDAYIPLVAIAAASRVCPRVPLKINSRVAE